MAVRIPLHVRERSRRTLEQRLALRFPVLAAAGLRLVGSLPPSSRLRRAALRRSIEAAAEAYNRRDLACVTIGWSPDFEYLPAPSLVEAGLAEARYRGPAGYRDYVESTAEVWGAEIRFEPTELIDLGDRVVVLADVPMRAQASGVPIDLRFAYVTTLENGVIVRQQEFHDHREALAAVGLAEPRREAAAPA